MASRSTRNLTRNVQSASNSSSTPSAQASPRKARKSFPNRGAVTRQSGNASTLASTPSTSQSSSQASTSTQKTGGGPSAKKRTRRRGSSSDDSLIINTQNVTLSQGQSSSDSEDVVSISKKKKTKKSTQRGDSNSEGSDVDYAPPSRDTEKSKKSVSVASGSSSSTLNDTRGARASKLNTSQFFGGINGSPSKQAGALKNLINKCVFYILVSDKKKHAIKKADIVKNVFENQSSKENYTTVLDEANKILQKTFGLEMLSLENQKNSYIVINILDPDHGIREFAEYSEEELQKRGLIFLLLTIIFMNENAIAEDKLWKALGALGVNSNSAVAHPVFGNIKKYVTVELVKQMYINYKCVNKDPIQYEITWGERAYQEVKKKDLLEFACDMMGDNMPEDWKLQFIDANPTPVNEA